MKLIIAGSRDLYPSFNFLVSAITMFELSDIECIVSGRCKGVDQEGEHLAAHFEIPVIPFEVTMSDWGTIGKKAGPLRNKKMAEYADALLLVHNNSNGSLSMKKEMLKLGKPVYEVLLTNHTKDYGETK